MQQLQVQRRVQRLEALLERVRRNRRIPGSRADGSVQTATSQEATPSIPSPHEVKGASSPPPPEPMPSERAASSHPGAQERSLRASVSVRAPSQEPELEVSAAEPPEPELEVSVAAAPEPELEVSVAEAPEPELESGEATTFSDAPTRSRPALREPASGRSIEPLAASEPEEPVARAVRPAPSVEPMTFGALLDASLSLRPR